MFEIPAVLLSWFYGLTNSYIAAIATDRRGRHGGHHAAHAEEHEGHARDAAARAADAQAAERASQRQGEAQRRDDEALPGAQGQSHGLVSAAGGADAGVPDHVPGAPRPDLPASRGGVARCLDGVECVRQRSAGGRSRLHPPLSPDRIDALPGLVRGALDALARHRPVEVGGVRDQRRVRHCPPLRPARGAARRPVLRPTTNGRRSSGDQPDDVADASRS